MKISVQWPIYLTATRLIKPNFPILRCLFGNPLNEFRKLKKVHISDIFMKQKLNIPSRKLMRRRLA